MTNGRFTTFTVQDYNAIYAEIANGTVVVPDDYDSLQTFLGQLNQYYTEYFTESIINPLS